MDFAIEEIIDISSESSKDMMTGIRQRILGERIETFNEQYPQCIFDGISDNNEIMFHLDCGCTGIYHRGVFSVDNAKCQIDDQ